MEPARKTLGRGASVKGFGASGPYADYKCFDSVAMAMAGAFSVTGEADGPPLPPGITVGDSGTGVQLALSITAAYVQRLRTGDYFKLPGVAETIDWAQALAALDARELEPGPVDETLGVLLKYQDDIAKLRGAEAARLIAESKQAAAA